MSRPARGRLLTTLSGGRISHEGMPHMPSVYVHQRHALTVPQVSETGQLQGNRRENVQGMQQDVHGQAESGHPLLERMRSADCPPLAWHCYQIAWFYNNPAPDINLKFCRSCDAPLPKHEQRIKCEKCRATGKYKQYHCRCEQCGTDFVRDKPGRRFCGVKCQNDWQRRK